MMASVRRIKPGICTTLIKFQDRPGPSTDPSALLDLTGQITREGRYPSAHGGFSDVWKGVWHSGDHEQKVHPYFEVGC